MFIRKIVSPLVALVMTLPLAASAATSYRDVLDTPAQESAFASKSLLNGVASAGKRVVAVGQRGHIVYSDDGGKTWTQARVPVSSDLVAVTFPTPGQGWAVGHDGVVLHTADAGATWTRQLEGRSAGQLLANYYAAQASAGTLGSPEAASMLVEETKRIGAQGAENPFLDVWFADENNGFIVGAFNQIFRTTDGGKSWEPWFHRTENPNRLHLYAIRQVGGALYIVGEQGTVLKLNPDGNRFVALDTGYKGSFFGVAGGDGAVLVHGLRGHAFRSQDGGKTWQKIETGLQDGITGAAGCGGERLVLVSQAGRLLVSDDAGASFRPVKVEQAMPASAVACLGNTGTVIVGARGVRNQAIQ
jgi:photosystem II stability/assembly factor-like uncharacterized protein